MKNVRLLRGSAPLLAVGALMGAMLLAGCDEHVTVVRDPSSPFHARELPESAKKTRVLGWILVLLLFLAATFCLLQGLNALRIFFHWDQWEAIFGSRLSDRAEIELYSRFWIAIAVVLVAIGFWAQWRLRRHAK